MWVLVRNLSSSIHPLEISFWGSLFGLLTFLPTFFKMGANVFFTKRTRLHFVRALCNGSALLAWFCETVGKRRWMALCFGGVGAVIVLQPGFQTFNLGTTLLLLTVLFSAIQRLISKSLVRTENSTTCVIYLMLFMVPITFIPSIFVWTYPTLTEFGILALIGVLLSTAHFAWMRALLLADISALEPTNFTRLIWGALLGFIFFSEIPTIWVWIGGLMIIMSTSYIARREAAIRTDNFKVPDFPN